jgi:hypothetical protein
MSETTCYAVTVSTGVPTTEYNPPFTIYLVLTENEQSALEAVRALVPATWFVLNARQTMIQRESIERLGLRPGQAHHL